MSTATVVQSGWERVMTAIENVRDRLHRTAEALEAASIPYAIIDGNAVAEHVGEVDQTAVRFTQDVDILLARSDLERAKSAMASHGFRYRHAASIDMFLDGPSGKARDAVHVIFANEKVRPEYNFPAPNIHETTAKKTGMFVNLDALLRMKLTSFRDKDRTHVRDMIDVGLIDATWLPKLPESLALRLKILLDDPEG